MTFAKFPVGQGSYSSVRNSLFFCFKKRGATEETDKRDLVHDAQIDLL